MPEQVKYRITGWVSDGQGGYFRRQEVTCGSLGTIHSTLDHLYHTEGFRCFTLDTSYHRIEEGKVSDEPESTEISPTGTTSKEQE